MRLCWSNLLLIGVVVVLGTASLLASCGQRGDLYLPEESHHGVTLLVAPQRS